MYKIIIIATIVNVNTSQSKTKISSAFLFKKNKIYKDFFDYFVRLLGL